MTNSYRTNFTYETLKKELEALSIQTKVEENQGYNYLLTSVSSGEKFYFDKYAKGIEVEDFVAKWTPFDGQYFDDGVIEDARIIDGTDKDGKPTKNLTVMVDVPSAKAYFRVFYGLEGYANLDWDARDIAKLKEDFKEEDFSKWAGKNVTVKFYLKDGRNHWRMYAKTEKAFDKPDYSPYYGMKCPVIGDISIKWEGISKTGKPGAWFACDFKCGPVTGHAEIYQSKDPTEGKFGSQLDKFNKIKSAIEQGLPAYVNFNVKDVEKWGPKLAFDYPKKGQKKESIGFKLSQIKPA